MSCGLALLLLLAACSWAQGEPPAAPALTLFTTVYMPILSSLPIIDQHRLMASKAFSTPYEGERAVCPARDYYVADMRPDLGNAPNATWMVVDMRPYPFCTAPPVNAIWPPDARIHSIFMPDGDPRCGYLNATVFRVGASIQRGVETIMSVAAALRWTDMILLSGTSCSMANLAPGVAVAIDQISLQYNITVHSTLGSTSMCHDLPFDRYPVMLLMVTSPEDTADTLVWAYQRGWLGPNRAIIFNTALSYMDGAVISQLIIRRHGQLGIATVERFEAITLHAGAVPSFFEMARRIQRFRDEWGQSGAPAMPTSILGSSIFQLATLARYVLLATNCPQFKFIPSLVWPDDPVDDAYLLRTTEPIGGVRASIKPFSGKQWKFYDMEGNIVADPMLMLDGQPRSIPVSRLPVSITVALVSDLPLNSRVQSRLSSFFASSGVIGRRSTKITLRPLYLSMPNNGSNCSELVSAVSAQSANIVLAVVGERCRRLLEAAFNSTNVCLMFAGQGLPVEQEPRARRTFVFGVPPLGALAGVATVLSRMQWHKAVVLTQNAVNDGDLRALGSANASLPPVVLELGSAGDTTLGVCSDDVLQKLLDALAEVKSRRTPLIVIDVEPVLLPCVFDLAAQLGLTERPYFFVLSARAGRGLYFLLPGRRDQLAGRLAYIAIDRVQPADSRFATALTDPSFSEPGFYRTAVVLFSTMAHFTLVGAERRMYTYGFGVDSAHTRLEVLRGVASISPSDSTTGLMQSVAYFDNGMTSGSHRVAALLPASTAVSYQAFAILGVRVPLAVIDPTALSRLAAPQPNDYSSLASSGETGGSGADDSTLAFLTLLAVPLAAFVGLLLWRRRQRQQEVQKEADTAIRLALPDGIEQSPPLAVIGPERLAVAQKWSMGTFSRVLLGVLDGETPVILKQWQLLERSPPEAVSQTTAQLRAEWQTVADMHYVPQVLGVYGFLGPSDRLTGVVVECCSAGDLHSFLLDESVSAATLCCLAADVAAGMAALVEAGAVHYDLTARRIYVLDGGRRCKLAHFGPRSLHIPHFEARTRLPSIRWCAPEVLKGETPTAASNVWSFGVVLYEMQTKGAVPFEDLTPVQVKTTVLAGGHVSLPAGSADQLWAAALSCFAFEPAQRPSFQALAEELAALAKLLESEHEHPRRQYHEHDVGDDLYDFMSLGNSAEALDDATAAVVEDLPLTVPAIRAVGTDHVIVAGEGYISTETANVERHSESDLLGNPAVYNKWSPAAMLMYADQQGMVVGKGRRRSSSLPLVDGAAPLESLSKHLRLLEYGGVAVGSANKARTSVA